METLASQVEDSPLPRLWLAVIEQAAIDAVGHAYHPTEDRPWLDTAWAWIDGPGLEYACDHAGLDPEWVRPLIRKYVGAVNPKRLCG